MKKLILLINTFLFFSVVGRQYIYPIASCSISDDISFMYVIHQQADSKLRLFAWNPHTKIAYPLLHSLFTPVNIGLLPSESLLSSSGFSFVDQGRIRIKKFNKRSPKTIELYDPIYDPASICWIDEHNGYFFGKKIDRYGIFHITSQGTVETLQFSHSCDCMYPQKIGDQLFYIQRSSIDQTGSECMHYRIMRTMYPAITYTGERSFNNEIGQTADMHDNTINAPLSSSMVIDVGSRPIAFLSMINERMGFFVEYMPEINNKEGMLTFVYHLMRKDNAGWDMRPLFTFEVPASWLFDTDNRLYESIIPLLPRYYHGTIYFSDQLKPYIYTMASGEVIALSNDQTIMFSPVYFEGHMYYGGLPIEEEYGSVSIQETDDAIFINLPNFSI